MPTIADYLKNLLKQRKDLADNLVQKGLDASDTELLDTLVPKVLDIQTKEDLDNELNLYNTELTEQETLIDNIIEALINKRFEGINLQELQVEAKKDEQIITPSGDVDGFNKVTVSPVTSNIDENIIPENIKEGVTILDVVGTLQGGSEEKPYHIKYGNYFFTNSNIRLNEFPDIASIFTEDLISTSYMFNNCSSLKEAPLFNTSQVTTMSHMFYGCSKLTTVPLYDTSKVTDMSSMFSGCSILTTLSGFADLGKAYDTTRSENYFNYKLDLSKNLFK